MELHPLDNISLGSLMNYTVYQRLHQTITFIGILLHMLTLELVLGVTSQPQLELMVFLVALVLDT